MVWARPLSDGAAAVALVNLQDAAMRKITVKFHDVRRWRFVYTVLTDVAAAGAHVGQHYNGGCAPKPISTFTPYQFEL